MDKRVFIFTVHCDSEYVEHPEFADLILTPAEIEKIGQAVDLIEPYGKDGIAVVEMRLGHIKFYDSEMSEDPDWRVEMEHVKITAYGISVTAYDKYSGDLYWSDSIPYAQMKNIEGTYKVPN